MENLLPKETIVAGQVRSNEPIPCKKLMDDKFESVQKKHIPD